MKKLYTINGHCLQEADTAEYLGVLTSNDLQWSNQVSAVKKQTAHLDSLRRN